MLNFEDEVAQLCLDKYASLKKTGKPSENEWTVLSGVVLQSSFKQLSVVSLCTGTKCLSGIELKNTKYEERGNRLSDSHAEILARRSFLRYLYNQIESAIKDQQSDIFHLEGDKLLLKDVSFHFFSSQTPCGDCSIIPKVKEEYHDSANPSKKMKRENCTEINMDIDYGLEVMDVHRTGAKCVDGEKRQDPKKDGADYHHVGPLRTKPGRGDRTLSLSCSDKIAKWNIMGAQGALLSLMIPPIRFKSIIIGGGSPYCLESMQRGIFKRFNAIINQPIIAQSKLSFEPRKQGLRRRPCPSSMVWCKVPERDMEIAVEGLKQGSTKKKNKSSSLLISRKELFKAFIKVYENLSDCKQILQHPKKLTYHHFKQYSLSYQNLWRNTLKTFQTWPIKPMYLQECLSF